MSGNTGPTSRATPTRRRAARVRQAGARTPAAKTGTEAKPTGAKDGAKDGVEAREGRDGDDTKTDADAAPVDPALAQWLAQLQRPSAESEAGALAHGPAHGHGGGTASTGEGAEDVGGDAAGTAALQAGDARGAASARAAAQQRHGQAADAADRGPVAGAQDTPARVAEESAAATPTARTAPESTFVLPTLPEPAAAAAASTAATPAAPAAAEAPVSAAVPVPMDSADFAEAFGVQVSVLARDGVQQAELHLNPAEMGPVSVQIAMDGERAHIDFGAQAAATRAAIEASLPELAAALRDAGLTLAGGGVSQQTSGRGDDARQGGSDRRDAGGARTAAVEPGAARPGWRGRVSAGGVDLYA